jgi:hypothetical protein
VSTWVWIVVAVVVVLVLAALLLAARRKQRTSQLQDRFGPEYDRAIETRGDRRAAEEDLAERAERREQLNLRPLAPAARERYSGQWKDTQARFVDDPDVAIGDADRLVGEVMRDRGYPTDDDFERRADDLSVDHPHLVENYRGAHRLVAVSRSRSISTEDQRQAMQHFRGMFDELLGDEPVDRSGGGRASGAYAPRDT